MKFFLVFGVRKKQNVYFFYRNNGIESKTKSRLTFVKFMNFFDGWIW